MGEEIAFVYAGKLKFIDLREAAAYFHDAFWGLQGADG